MLAPSPENLRVARPLRLDDHPWHRNGLDMLHTEGRTRPMTMSVGLHMCLIDHPARAAGLGRFLDDVQGHAGVRATAGSTSPAAGRRPTRSEPEG